MRPTLRTMLVLVLLALGAALAVTVPSPPVAFGWGRWIAVLAAVAVALIPAVSTRIVALAGLLREPEPRQRLNVALIVAVVAGFYLAATAFWQDRDLFPKTHDEQSYFLQARMLSEGRLWLPPHPHGDFFDTFHVLVDPVYASAYFPGNALMFAPGLVVGWPTWAVPILLSAAGVGLLYRVLAELVDGAAALLASLALVSLGWFRVQSPLMMAQVPALFLGLLMVWAWLRWRAADGRTRLAWAAAVGAFAGWMAITRPVDALAYALPVGAAMAVSLAKGRAAPKTWLATGGVVVLAAAPFLALQLTLNKAVTGELLRTPFGLYVDRDQPGTGMGFADDAATMVSSGVPQKRELNETFVAPRVAAHRFADLPATWTGERLRFTLDVPLPARPMLPIALVGLLGLTTARRLVLAATLAAFVGLYALYTFYLEHYLIVVAPAALMLLVLGVRVLASTAPARWRRGVSVGLGCGVAAGCATVLPEADALLFRGPADKVYVTDETFPSRMMRVLRTELPAAVPGRALIFVRWSPGQNVHQEPVYNTAAARVDDNRIVLAHDLGARNAELIAYYARTQLDRVVYLFDRASVDDPSAELFVNKGTVAALAGAGAAPTSVPASNED